MMGEDQDLSRKSICFFWENKHLLLLRKQVFASFEETSICFFWENNYLLFLRKQLFASFEKTDICFFWENKYFLLVRKLVFASFQKIDICFPCKRYLSIFFSHTLSQCTAKMSSLQKGRQRCKTDSSVWVLQGDKLRNQPMQGFFCSPAYYTHFRQTPSS